MEAARRLISFGPEAQDRRLELRWDLAGIFRRAAILVAVEATVIVSLVAFRLGSQFMAWRPGLPWSGLYWLSGIFVGPFQRFEMVKQNSTAVVIQYSALVALETYMLAGLLLVLALAGLSLIARRYGRRSFYWTVDAGPLYDSWRNLETSLASFAEDAEHYGDRVTGVPHRRPETPRLAPRQPINRRWHAPGSSA